MVALTSKQITHARKQVKWREQSLHGSDDCVRIAYQWLDAQKKTKNPVQRSRALKHMIENWGGRYVSQTDVEVAALMHPEIIGDYPRFNVSARLIQPAEWRLKGISEARTHSYSMRDDAEKYVSRET